MSYRIIIIDSITYVSQENICFIKNKTLKHILLIQCKWTIECHNTLLPAHYSLQLDILFNSKKTPIHENYTSQMTMFAIGNIQCVEDANATSTA